MYVFNINTRVVLFWFPMTFLKICVILNCTFLVFKNAYQILSIVNVSIELLCIFKEHFS